MFARMRPARGAKIEQQRTRLLLLQVKWRASDEDLRRA
jgi:hypothetical protein